MIGWLRLRRGVRRCGVTRDLSLQTARSARLWNPAMNPAPDTYELRSQHRTSRPHTPQQVSASTACMPCMVHGGRDTVYVQTVLSGRVDSSGVLYDMYVRQVHSGQRGSAGVAAPPVAERISPLSAPHLPLYIPTCLFTSQPVLTRPRRSACTVPRPWRPAVSAVPTHPPEASPRARPAPPTSWRAAASAA